MKKVKIISKLDYFFDFQPKKMFFMMIIGIIFGFTCRHLTLELPFELKISYRLCIVLISLLMCFFMLFIKLERQMVVFLPILLIIWNLAQIGWILFPICVFLFLFFAWISQVSNFKHFFVIIIISTIILKIIVESIV